MSLRKLEMLTIGRIESVAKLGLYETIVIESGHLEMIFKRTGYGVDFIIPAPPVIGNITHAITGDNIMDADYCYWSVYFK